MTKSSISEAVSFVKKETKELSNQAKKISLHAQMKEKLSYLQILHNEGATTNKDDIEKTQKEIASLNSAIKKLGISEDFSGISNSLANAARELVSYFGKQVDTKKDDYHQNLNGLAINVLGREDKQDFSTFQKLYLDTFGGQDILKFTPQEKALYDVGAALIELHKAQLSLEEITQSASAATLKTEKRLVQSAYLIDTIPQDSGLRFLFDLDGDDILETNQFVKDSGLDWKIAKKQQKNGDDSFIDLGDKKANKKNEKFAGYDTVSMVSAYNYVKEQGLSEAQIATNIISSLKINIASFKQYVSYRLIGRDNRGSIEELIDAMASGSIDMKNKEQQKMIQIYMVDFLRQAGVEPSDVFAGNLKQKINYQETDHKAEESVKVDITTVQKAIQDSDKKDLYANLNEGQKRWLDIHIAGLWAYVQQNKMVVKNITPLENRDPNADYSDKVTNNEFGSLSAAFVQTVLDHSGDENHPFHIDFAAIPMAHISGLDGGTIKGDIYVGPNGAYTLINGEKFKLVATGYAGYGLSSKSITTGGGLSASQKLENKKLGAKSKSVELSVGAGWNSIGGPFMTGSVGMDIDDVATVMDNARKVGELFNPIVGGLPDTVKLEGNATDYAAFRAYILDNHTSTIKKNQIKELYGSLVVAKELAGGLEVLKKNPQGVFAELIKQIYQHNQQLDLRGMKYGGVNVDFVQLLLSPNFWGKLRALFGVVKLKNHRTAITQSGTYLESNKHPLISQEEIKDKEMTSPKRAQLVSTKLNKASKSIIGGSGEMFGFNERGYITVAKSALIIIDGVPSDGTKVLEPKLALDVVVYPDHIKITTSEPEESMLQTTTRINTTTLTINVPQKDSLNVPSANPNVADVCLTQEPTSVLWKEKINEYLNQTTISHDPTVVRDHYTKIRGRDKETNKTFIELLDISRDTTLLTNDDIKNALTNSTRLDYGQLNLWLLCHYTFDRREDPTVDPAYNVYNRLLRYEKTLTDLFIEPWSQDQYIVDKNGKSTKNLGAQKGMLRVSDRYTALNNWTNSNPQDGRMFDETNKLASAQETTRFQGYADINNFESSEKSNVSNVSGYVTSAATFNFGHDADTDLVKDGWTILDYHRFITNDHPDNKTFEGTFAHHNITDDTTIARVKQILKPSEASRIKQYKANLENILSQVNALKINIDGVDRSLVKLNYVVDTSQVTDLLKNYGDVYDVKDILIPVKDSSGREIIQLVVDRKSNSGFRVVGNKQCHNNLTVAYASQWILKSPEPIVTEEKIKASLAGANISHASEVVNVNTLVRGGVLGGGAGLQNGEYLNGTKPGEHIPNTDPNGIDPNGGKPIDPNAPKDGGSIGGFNPNNPPNTATDVTNVPVTTNPPGIGGFNPENTTWGSGQEILPSSVVSQKTDIHNGKTGGRSSKSSRKSKNKESY